MFIESRSTANNKETMVQDHIYKGLDIIFSSKILSRIIFGLFKKRKSKQTEPLSQFRKIEPNYYRGLMS
jgi:hypothetical protein